MSFLIGLFWFLLLLAMVASIAVWGHWLACWSRGESPIGWQPREPVPWGGAEVTLVVLFYVAITNLVWQCIPETIEGTARALLVSTISNVLILALAPGLLFRFAGGRRSDFGVQTSGAARDFSYGSIALLAAVLPVSVVQLIVTSFLASEDRVHPIIQAIREDSTAEMWYLVGLSAVVVAPMVEEFLFRGVLQGWLEKRIHPVLAIVTSSVAFSAMHSTSWPDPVPLLPLALVLGYVYYRRHSLLAVVVLHAGFNAVNLLILAVNVTTGAGKTV